MLLGLGAVLEWGSSTALTQVYIVIALQLGLAVFLFLCAPGIDRFECCVTALQFLLEGVGSTLLVAASAETTETSLAGFVVGTACPP